MTPKRIDYASYPMDAASLLKEHEITRRHISEEDRLRTIKILNGALAADQPTPWEFTLKEVTIVGQGADEAGHFLGSYE